MKPQKLQINDCVGIFSSSSPTNQKALDNLKSYFENRGYRTKIAPNTLCHVGYMAGTPEERASDFNSLVADNDVKLIMTANGGASAIQLLPLIDYSLFSRNPKLVVGLSDPTCLLNALTTITGIVTIHGPNGYNFGHKTPSKFTEDNWWEIITGNFKMPYSYPVKNEVKKLKNSNPVNGQLIGGNLRNMVYLLGTPYSPNFENAILFIEEIGMPIHEIDALINHLKLAGVFKKVSGLIVGQFVGCEENEGKSTETLEDMILRNISEFNFPILSNMPLGHTSDKVTLPIGGKIQIDTKIPSIDLVENPFQ